MAVDVTLNTQAFSYADFQSLDGKPVSQQTLDSIRQGDIGKITGVSIDSGHLVVSTDKGTFTFKGPKDDLPPGDSKSLNDPGGTSSRVGSDLSGLATVFEIMQLLHTMNKEQKALAREAKQASVEMQHDQLMKAADDIRNGAIIALVCGVVSGAISIGAAGMQAYGAAKGLSALKGAKSDLQIMTKTEGVAGKEAEFGTAKTSITDKSTYAQNIGQLWSARAQGATGIGQIINSFGQFGNSMYQAEQKEHEANAQMAGAIGDRESDFVNSMKEAQQKIMEILGAIEAANNESTKSILRA